MKIYIVNPVCYGDLGSIVIAKNKDHAKKLYLKKYPYNSKFKISITYMIDVVDIIDKGWVSESFLE